MVHEDEFVLLRGGGAQGNERRRTATRAARQQLGSYGSGKFPERFRITSSGRAGIISCRAPRVSLSRATSKTGAAVERSATRTNPEEARGRSYGTLQMTVVIDRNGTLLDAIIRTLVGSAGAGPRGAPNC